MSNKYDVESFIDDIVGIIQGSLSTKVTAMNAEKNDGLELVSVDDANYYDDISQQVLNVDPFIYYTPVELDTTTQGQSTSLKVTIAVSVVFGNLNASGTIKKVLRYSRILREILQENFKPSSKVSQLKIIEFIPTDIALNDGSDFKIGGVQVSGIIVG